MARGKYLGPLDDGPIFPRDIPDSLLRAQAEQGAEADALRRALIRLLWREVADGGGCSCDDGDPRPTDTCEAMRALGWGEHWEPEIFQRRAMEAIHG